MRYDRRDPDVGTLKLTRAGHYLWFQYLRLNSGGTQEQREAIMDALEIIWAAKRQVKAELVIKRSAEFEARKHLFAVQPLDSIGE